MSDIHVELLSCYINKLSVELNFEENTVGQIQVHNEATVYEPKDETDPTILIMADCSVSDVSGKLLNMTCEAQFIFSFDPIPANRGAAAREHCYKIMHETIIQKTVAVLNGMGHNFQAGNTTVLTPTVSDK